MKNICIITGSRSEYGLLKGIIQKFYDSKDFNLILLVTGTHLEKNYGLTYRNIEEDGFKITEKIYMNLSNDTSFGIIQSMSLEMNKLSECFNKHNIDLIFILGDRYEMLICAQVALIYNIPIAHLCGGDITQGAYDNAIRNSITQMARYHFVTCESSFNNLLKMNIDEEYIYLSGNPGLYDILNFTSIDKNLFFNSLQIQNFNLKMILIVYHPETLLTEKDNIQNFNILKNSLLNISNFKNINFIFIYPNADSFNNFIIHQINELTVKYNNIYSLKSISRKNYLNLIYYCNLFIGNSSSGIYEVPIMKKITLNLGDRQKGRECGKSVIHIKFIKNDIIKEIEKYLNNFSYLNFNFFEKYPYILKDSSEEIISIVKNNFKKTKKNIAVIGCGGHSRVIIDTLLLLKKINNLKEFNILGFYDDDISKKEYNNIKNLGNINDIKNVNNETYYIIGIGDLKIRQILIDKFDNLNWINVIHPSSQISSSVTLEKGIFINANSCINSQAVIKNHCIINSNSVVEHDVIIGENCHCCPNTTICGHVQIKKNTFIGASSTIINKNKNGFITIGSDNFLNAGSLILHSTKNKQKIRGIF